MYILCFVKFVIYLITEFILLYLISVHSIPKIFDSLSKITISYRSYQYRKGKFFGIIFEYIKFNALKKSLHF